ncbi:Chromate transporter [Candidatus Hepatincolaceae symbiont of Richtersius coronifer]
MSFLIFLWATFLVGIFSFGGGKAFIPIYQNLYVDTFKVVDSLKLSEVIGFAIALPGPTSPMITAVIGFQKFGIFGMFLGLLILTVPTVTLLFILWKIISRYQDTATFKRVSKYMSPAIIGLLVGVVAQGLSNYTVDNWSLVYNTVIFGSCTYLVLKFKIHPIFLVLGTGFLGILLL